MANVNHSGMTNTLLAVSLFDRNVPGFATEGEIRPSSPMAIAFTLRDERGQGRVFQAFDSMWTSASFSGSRMPQSKR